MDFQEQLREARERRNAEFLREQAAKEKAAEVEKAAAEAKKAKAERSAKLEKLLKRAEEVAALPPVDKFVRVIGRFIRRFVGKSESEMKVVLRFLPDKTTQAMFDNKIAPFDTDENGLKYVRAVVKQPPQEITFEYSLGEALQMYDLNVAPFDNPRARLEVDRTLRKQQNLEDVIASSRDLSEEKRQLLMMTAWMNLGSVSLDDVRYPDFLFELMTGLGVTEPDEMMRKPFAEKGDVERLELVFWFRVFLHSQREIPSWVGTTSAEWMKRAEMQMMQKLISYNEAEARRQQRLEEICRPVLPDEMVQCCNDACGVEKKASLMYRKNGGSFYFCKNCAPLVGIYVPFSPPSSPAFSPPESPILPPISSPLPDLGQDGSDLEPEQDI